jgi:hypothetical protein
MEVRELIERLEAHDWKVEPVKLISGATVVAVNLPRSDLLFDLGQELPGVKRPDVSHDGRLAYWADYEWPQEAVPEESPAPAGGYRADELKFDGLMMPSAHRRGGV